MLKNILKLLTPGCELSKKIYYRYNIAHWCYKKSLVKIANYYSYKIYKKYNCCIAPGAIIGKNINFPHPVGVVIGEGVNIGDNCTIYQNVTIGRKDKDIADYPTVGNNVIIYCNSVVIGDITIGNNCIIGCNSVVLKSIEDNSKCVGVVK